MDEASRQIQEFPRICPYVNHAKKQLLILSAFSITDTNNSQDSRGRKGPLYFSIPF